MVILWGKMEDATRVWLDVQSMEVMASVQDVKTPLCWLEDSVQFLGVIELA